MTSMEHMCLAVGLAQYAAAADEACRPSVAQRLKSESRAHLERATGAAAELLGTRMPALGGVAA